MSFALTARFVTDLSLICRGYGLDINSTLPVSKRHVALPDMLSHPFDGDWQLRRSGRIVGKDRGRVAHLPGAIHKTRTKCRSIKRFATQRPSAINGKTIYRFYRLTVTLMERVAILRA
jgi:hypothetical protein